MHYAEGVDYSHGSPHLSDVRLRQELSGVLVGALHYLQQAGLPPRVLEIGAGHGGYTEPALAAGAEVTAVDMSRPALRHLADRFGSNPRLECVHTPDGSLDRVSGDYSLLLCVSVLHHIPDYLAFLEEAVTHLRNGGCVLTIQDPLSYQRLHWAVHRFDRMGYMTWRLGQGDLRRGAASLTRRIAGRMSEDRPEDMVEYHVLRSGVDEDAILRALSKRFDHVDLHCYWANQLPVAQRLGRRLEVYNTFGLWARGYTDGP